MNKEEIIRNRDALIYDFDKVKPEHRILYEKLNADLALLELDEKYQKVLAFMKEAVVTEKLSTANHYYLIKNIEKLLKEIGEL